jgi:hypothetical protein
MTNFVTSRAFLGTMAAILATGAVLNMANRGTFGDAVKKLSNYITTGYGAGSL